ncbi:hypothetical protein LS68_008020 [Helicobacter sp. MIT 05-5293]|uniref:hypothetical protein n=1 Tax=Helicobacter sp. MIT 05-5293 TaxID=1548149 RepID=UPI00051E0D18|nr:hypothetical protein [Helicobacter sp. MIT 05-5293]TLD80154.1 hypothetical protein LS68_008020 [Helicobacter sp. MIT 05-5293]
MKGLVFRANMKKISQDFGNVSAMAKAFNIKHPTLEHIIYKKTTFGFRSDSVREAVNRLIAGGYLTYTDEVQSQSSHNEVKE